MQTDYFMVEATANNSHPLLTWDEYIVGFGKPAPLHIGRPVKLRLGSPVPKNPVMVDHHTLPQPVFSARIAELLESLRLFGVQLVEATVKVAEGDERRYWILHAYNEIACLDSKLSEVSRSKSGRVLSIAKLVLDERVLKEIPLERRLLFILAESTSVYLFHQSLVERVLALEPEGLRFIRVDQWNDSAGFRGEE